jgi:hypothetical protein
MSFSDFDSATVLRGRHVAVFVVACLTLVAVCSESSVTYAQATTRPAYQALPIDAALLADEKGLKNLQQLKGRVLLGTAPFEANRAAFENWYTMYFFRAFTKLDELDELPEKRDQLKKELRSARDPGVRQKLLELTFSWMRGFATSQKFNFHPAVRFNALLMIGDLNANEKTSQQSENPLPEALDVLLAEFRRPNQTDTMKIAAMLGILRHAQLDWTRPAADRIKTPQRIELINAMMTLVDAAEPPPTRSEAGHVWMQRRAIHVLAYLGAVGPINEVNQALERIVGDPNYEVALRCTAASALQQINPTAAQREKFDTVNVSLNLGALAAQVTRDELDRIEEDLLKGQRPGASGGYGMSGGYGSGGYESEYDMYGSGMSGEMDYPGMAPGGMGMSPGGMGMSPGGMGMGMGEMGSDMGYPGGGEMGYPGMGGGYPSAAAKKDPRMDPYRKRLKARLDCVQHGLAGLTKLATEDPLKSEVGAVTEKVDSVMAATDPPKETPTLMALVEGLKEAVAALEVATRKATANSVPLAEEEEEVISDEPMADLPPDEPAAPPAAPAPETPPPAGKKPPTGAGGPADAP